MQRLRDRLEIVSHRQTGLDSSLAIVNIVLLLIFFFIATGSILASGGVAMLLPDTTELPLDMLPSPLLFIDADGTMVLDDVPVEVGTLAARTLDDPVLHVLVDRNHPAQEMLATLAREELVAQEIRLVTIHRKAGDGT